MFDSFISGGFRMMYLLELWSMQWLTSIGVMLAVLGVLYMACNYLDKKLYAIKTLTDGFAIGIVISFLFVFFSLISVLFNSVSIFFLQDIYHENIALPTPDTSTGFSIVVPGGLIIGVVLGMLYNILKGRRHYFYRNLFLFGLVGFMLMLCCSIGIVEWSLSPGLFSSHQIIFSLLLYSFGDIGGCLFGMSLSGILYKTAIIQKRKLLWRNLIMFFLLFLMLLLLFILFNSNGDHHIYEKVLEGIFYYSQLGLLIGISVDKWSQRKKEVSRVTWGDFIFWLFLGGIAIPIIFLAMLSINSANQPFIYFILHYFLLLGIINGQGDKIIKHIKFRGRLKNDRVHPSINWKRFICGLIIGILYVIPVALFTLLIDVLLRHPVGLVIYNFLQNLDFSILVGLVIGFIYGFGPLVLDRIEYLDERRLVQLGMALTVSGIFIAVIPH